MCGALRKTGVRVGGKRETFESVQAMEERLVFRNWVVIGILRAWAGDKAPVAAKRKQMLCACTFFKNVD